MYDSTNHQPVQCQVTYYWQMNMCSDCGAIVSLIKVQTEDTFNPLPEDEGS